MSVKLGLSIIHSYFHRFFSLQQSCRTINDLRIENDVEAYAWFVEYHTFGQSINPSYEDSINDMRNTSYEAITSMYGIRQMHYIACSEFGSFRTSEEGGMFGNRFPLEYTIQHCADVFGDEWNAETIQAGVDRTNRVYGGINPGVTNVIFTHGAMDPVRLYGITESLGPQAPAIVMSCNIKYII